MGTKKGGKMNYNDLYTKEDVKVYDGYIFYLDENCAMPYTGHVEDYFKGKLSWECDIVDGVKNGIEKTYYGFTGELECINEVKENMGNGLAMEFYKSGKVMSISTTIDNLIIDSYSYSEEGELEEISIWGKDNSIGINYSRVKEKIPELRKRYDLEKLNEEILQYGIPMEFRKHFYRETE